MRTAIFNSHGQDSDLRQFDGQEVTVLGEIPAETYDARDVGAMYRVVFADGPEVGVFADELTGDSIPKFSQYYTSGRAGVTKDRTPYVVVSPLDGSTHRVAEESTSPVESCEFDPRPWFDNHNPILQSFRLRKPDEQHTMSWILDDAVNALRMHSLGVFQGIVDRDGIDAVVSEGHRDHALRVLTKRQALR